MSKRSILSGILMIAFLAACRPSTPVQNKPDGEPERLGKPPKSRAVRDLPSWVSVPGGDAELGSREEGAPPPRTVRIRAFWMTRTEITTAQFAAYLNDTGREFASPQFAGRPGRYSPLAAREPVAFVAYDDAQDYARWLSSKLNVEVSLPTPDEWEYAARGGLKAAPYPWGWESPLKRAAFRLDKVRPVGCYPPNPYRLYDMAGNVAEWCRTDGESELTYIRGGSWSERSESMLRVWRRISLPKTYRGADVGFRVIARPLSTPAR